MSQLSRTLLFKRTNFASFCFLIYGTSPASFTLIVVFPNHWFEGRIIVDELLSTNYCRRIIVENYAFT